MTDAATRLAHVRDRIARSAKAARRDAKDITLVAVTKQRGVAEIEPLIAAGVTDFGENRAQEAAEKWPALRADHPNLKLHMIGRLQSNKSDEAVRLFDVIHSVDRPSLLEGLVKAAGKTHRFPEIYVQVNIGAEEQKGGVAIADLPAFLEQVRASPLPLAGLMGMPPLGHEPGPYFALLAELARRHGVAGLSMGMSGDYETAVMLGATLLRVGTALFED
ncbi:MAG TPA: YggS family pyridoxal phosphate-dependent enzyme [Sphingomicrobium sp.]|nr:YggS family pyridoxal phosphate-dependent enzyme [Sphingomicrobium sp.]